MPTLIASLVMGAQALKEFQLLLHTLEQWEPTAEAFVFADTATAGLLRAVGTRITLHIRTELDAYTGLTRKDMEARDGRIYNTMFHDFTMEKAKVLKWVFEERVESGGNEGVWFLDADICLLAPLPQPVAEHRLALSPHYIRPADEARYGRFNAGMLWVRDIALLDVWRRAAYGSRFYEQAALEAVWAAVPAEEREELPLQNNFGWWRHAQSVDPPPAIEARIGYNRRLVGCGLTYDGQVLRSLHTHWDEANDFNIWMRGRLEFIARSHPPAKDLVQTLGRLFHKGQGQGQRQGQQQRVAKKTA